MERQALPLIPVPFRLVVRQVRTEEGYVTDPVAIRQLEVLRGLLENADALVIATDAGREGELVSRYLLDYLGYRKPALRLWISSLTEKAILNGFKNLREDGDFDNLALAARARREADWILGVNASIALGIAAGMGNHSLGRVQTPTLALVCRRYLENRDFVPVSFYHLRTGVCKDGQKVLFTRPLRYERKEDAEKARAGLEGEALRQCYQDAFGCDAYFTSSNAITTDGVLYNVDGNSNRVACIVFGPRQVIMIVGRNKIVDTFDQAVERVKRIAAPRNTQRLHCKTPCAATGHCISLDQEDPALCDGCFSPQRVCCNYVTTAFDRHIGRIKVLIVDEELGY